MKIRINRLNIVFCLLVLINIVGVFINKDNWANEGEEIGGWQNSVSKILYAIVILLMLPSVLKSTKNYSGAKCFSFLIMLYVAFAIAVDDPFDFGSVSKFLLLCISFVFFERELSRSVINKLLLYFFIISSLLFTSARIFSANIFLTAIDDGVFGTGQSASLAVIYLLPLVFYSLNKKLSTYIYMFGFILVMISLRRTAILAYLLCVPFVFTTIKNNLSKTFIFIVLTAVGVAGFYFISEYWWVIEARFLDMFEPDRDGRYGSGRTGWFAALLQTYFENPLYWLQGFGVGSVREAMTKMGSPFGHAHNDYIEIIFTYGLIGIFLWYSNFLSFLNKVKSSFLSKDDKRLSYMCILSVLIIAMATNEIDDPTFISVPIFMSLITNKLEGYEVNIV